MGGCMTSQPVEHPTAKLRPQQPVYAQQVAYAGYAQDPVPPSAPAFQPYHQQQQGSQMLGMMPGCGPQPPFMRTLAPNGSPWSEYVRTGYIGVDPGTGFLSGPWAECVCWGVRFEHGNDWQSMPEYAGGDGPVGGVLAALEASTAGRADTQCLLEAAARLEEAAHSAADAGQPLPVIGGPQRAPFGQPAYMQPGACEPPTFGQPAYGGHPACAQPMYGQQYGGGQGFGYQPAAQPYAPQQAYASAPAYGQAVEPEYYQPPYAGAGGPTLLQQQSQYQGGAAGGGMGGGAKMAMAAAGGVAAGVGGYYLATHMDDVGEAFGDAAGAVGHAGEAALGFAGHAVEGMGDFVGHAAEDVVDFVEDVF